MPPTGLGAAAKALDELRSNWLNPPGGRASKPWSFPATWTAPGLATFTTPTLAASARCTFRVANDEDAKKLLAKRTLTNLYNQKPEWLQQAHRRLDDAVFAAYGWDPAMSDDDLLAALLKLNLLREPA